MRKRRTARVMLFDEGGAVLLIRFVAMRPDGEFVFWALPGGEIEAGETETEAAARELREELGIGLRWRGRFIAMRTSSGIRGRCRTIRIFCFGRECWREEPQLTGLTAEEIAMMREMRWWTAAEIEGQSRGEDISGESGGADEGTGRTGVANRGLKGSLGIRAIVMLQWRSRCAARIETKA